MGVSVFVVWVVFGFFFAGEFDGEAAFVTFSVGSLSDRRRGLLISFMISFRLSLPWECWGAVVVGGRGMRVWVRVVFPGQLHLDWAGVR